MNPQIPEVPHVIHCTFEMGAFHKEHLALAEKDKLQYTRDWEARLDDPNTTEETLIDEGLRPPKRYIVPAFSDQISTVNEAVASLIRMLLVKHLGEEINESNRIMLFEMAILEVLQNSGMHACEGVPRDGVQVRLSFFVNEHNDAIVLLGVIDNGPKFTLNSVPDCTADENLGKASGRGTEYMTNFADDAFVNVDEFAHPDGGDPKRGNVVILLLHMKQEEVSKALE